MVSKASVRNRFHVIDEAIESLDSTWSTLRGALDRAQQVAQQSKRLTSYCTIWDNMARVGAKQEWKVTPDGHATIVARRVRR